MNCEKFRDCYDQYTQVPIVEQRLNLEEWQAWQTHVLDCSACYEWDLTMESPEKKVLCGHDQLKFIQTAKTHPQQCPGNLITLDENSQTYGLPISDSATTLVTIFYCPWCGTKLDAP